MQYGRPALYLTALRQTSLTLTPASWEGYDYYAPLQMWAQRDT